MKTICMFFLLGIACFCNAEMTSSQILTKATAVFLNTSFRAKMVTSADGLTTSFMYFQSISPSGVTYSLMKPLNGNIKTSFLVNTKGRFEIIGDIAIRADYIKKAQIVSPQIPIQKNANTFIVDGKEVTREMIGDKNFSTLVSMSRDSATTVKPNHKDITCSNIDYYGFPCYQIKYKYDTEDGIFTNEQIVDKNTFFTYQKQTFNQRGKTISKTVYSDVIINPVFEKDFFDLPRGAKIVIAKTLKDGNHQSSIALEKVTPPPQIPKQPSKPGA